MKVISKFINLFFIPFGFLIFLFIIAIIESIKKKNKSALTIKKNVKTKRKR
jgi:hypothetical protein